MDTELTARGKVCPLLNEYCVGGGCMAWRWVDEDIKPRVVPLKDKSGRQARIKFNEGDIPPSPEDFAGLYNETDYRVIQVEMTFVENDPVKNERYASFSAHLEKRNPRGYCGMAGAPSIGMSLAALRISRET